MCRSLTNWSFKCGFCTPPSPLEKLQALWILEKLHSIFTKNCHKCVLFVTQVACYLYPHFGTSAPVRTSLVWAPPRTDTPLGNSCCTFSFGMTFERLAKTVHDRKLVRLLILLNEYAAWYCIHIAMILLIGDIWTMFFPQSWFRVRCETKLANAYLRFCPRRWGKAFAKS